MGDPEDLPPNISSPTIRPPYFGRRTFRPGMFRLQYANVKNEMLERNFRKPKHRSTSPVTTLQTWVELRKEGHEVRAER